MLGRVAGFRNAQTTVIAPTGTIGFMMDCDTTGIEPDLALVKYKKLVGGGVIKIVNQTVPNALIKLGYSSDQVSAFVEHFDSTGTIEGAPHLKDLHLACFDCSFRPQIGSRSIQFMGHVRMMAAVQPFTGNLQDYKHAGRAHGGRRHDRLHRELEARIEGRRDADLVLQPLSSGTSKGAKAATDLRPRSR